LSWSYALLLAPSEAPAVKALNELGAIQSCLDVESLFVKDEVIVWIDWMVSFIEIWKHFGALQVSGIPEDFLDLFLLIPNKVVHLNEEHVNVDLVKRK